VVVRERLAAREEFRVADDRVLHGRPPADLRPGTRDLLVGASLRGIVRAVDEEERRMESVVERAGDLAVLVDPVVHRRPLRPGSPVAVQSSTGSLR
jgi:hypothetical protein